MPSRKNHFEVVRRADIAPLLNHPAPARILSVTYDPSLAKTRELLFSSAGIEVSSFLNTRAAIQACETQSFDLIVVGHSIPLVQRRVLVKKLRVLCTAPILALTRHGEPILADADHFFDPSESPEQLLATVLKILRSEQR